MTQILHAGRTVTKVVVAFDVSWEGDLSGAGSVLWAMSVTSQDGSETVELGYRRTADGFAEQYVHDLSGERQQTFDEDADFRDGEITVRFPTSSVGVATTWPTWRAVINVDGQDVAEHVIAPT
jgi:hypothetical protein